MDRIVANNQPTGAQRANQAGREHGTIDSSGMVHSGDLAQDHRSAIASTDEPGRLEMAVEKMYPFGLFCLAWVGQDDLLYWRRAGQNFATTGWQSAPHRRENPVVAQRRGSQG